MKKLSPSRRQFLHGAGGFTLALPFLPSLLHAREAKAASKPTKKFIQICTGHGGIWGSNMYPGDATLTDSMNYGGRMVKRGTLVPQSAAGNRAQLSPVLSGPATLLTTSLASKMNIIRGCDVPFYIGHHTGGFLGNYARNDGNGTDGVYMQGFPTPTIDQVMAWSPKFYSDTDLTGIRQRVVVVGPKVSYNWSNPSPTAKDPGPVQEVAGSIDAPSLFKQIFITNNGSGTPDPNAMTSPVVDRVMADYTRLRNSNTRLSNDDRHRLDDHMQRLSELQRRLNVHTSMSCPTVKPVTLNTNALFNTSAYYVDPTLQTQVYQAMNDVFVAAILCDTSRIGVMNIREDFSTYVGDWHADIAHHSDQVDGVNQKVIAAAHQLTFEKVFLDICSKLDIDDGTGKTYLDNSLVVWAQESGEYTHNAQAMPIVAAGSAGGFLKTGNYCDYRNPAFVPYSVPNPAVPVYTGLLWQQWLGTVLQAMGLQPSDYEKNGLGGYPGPVKFIGSNQAKFYPDDVWKVAGEILPFLKA